MHNLSNIKSNLALTYILVLNVHMISSEEEGYRHGLLYYRYCEGKRCRDCVLNSKENCYISKVYSRVSFIGK